jgi:dTDP-4-dehydrorhamnose 3,5-epimerase
MKADSLAIPEVVLIEPGVFSDDRGHFFESFSQRAFGEATGLDLTFVQDNQSRSRPWVLRGIHYQLDPYAQGKLVRVVRGAVYDVAVDLRRSSATFGQSVAVELSEANRRQLWVPPGFGHAFLALADGADLLYKTTEYYLPQSDRSIRWDDGDIGIEWPLARAPLLSDKDRAAPGLNDAEVFT